jgi:hypothetical protein
MKISTFGVLIVMLFSVLIISSIGLSCSSYKPYSPEMMNSGMYPYEGFSNLIANKSSCQSSVGFGGLLCSPDENSNPKDIYSDAKGSLGCKSYGYSNSRGFLCMEPEQVRLLTSRGGNASGLV